jgi:hypothetical protein
MPCRDPYDCLDSKNHYCVLEQRRELHFLSINIAISKKAFRKRCVVSQIKSARRYERPLLGLQGVCYV